MVPLEKGEGGFAITGVDLDAEASIPDRSATFEKIAQSAKDNCPVGKASRRSRSPFAPDSAHSTLRSRSRELAP